MQVLEVYHERDKSYFLLSKDVIDDINATKRPKDSVPLGEDTICDWTVSVAVLRRVLGRVKTATDAVNLTQLILSIGGKATLQGLSWQKMIASSGVWYDLKPKFRAGIEERGITDGTFIFQGV